MVHCSGGSTVLVLMVFNIRVGTLGVRGQRRKSWLLSRVLSLDRFSHHMLVLQLLLVDDLVLGQLLKDVLRISLLVKLDIVKLLVLLVPAPLVDLRLGQPGGLRHSDAGLFGPVGVLRVLSEKVLHLVRILPVPLLLVGLVGQARLLLGAGQSHR